jgi:hypothetical protein
MFFWRLPFQRWPLQHHMLAAGLGVMALAAGGWWYLHKSQTALIVLQGEHLAAQRQLDLVPSQNKPREQTDFQTMLPGAARADDVVRDVNRFAQSLGVQINSLAVENRAGTVSELAKVQFNVVAQAEYKNAKTWLAELLARYPTLAVHSMSLRAQPNGGARQDVRVTLVLFVKG